MTEVQMTNCTRCGEPKDVHDAGENYACQAQPTVTFQEEGEALARVARAIETADYTQGKPHYLHLARAAILAMTNARDGTE